MRWRGPAVALGLLLAALVLLLGWAVMGPDRARAPAAELHERGRAVYNYRCYFCHGYSGDARTLATTYLAPPPRDFTAATPQSLPVERIAAAVREGRPGTAMASFAGVLSAADIEAVAAFVAREFVRDKAPNTAYHTAANGWPGHERHAVAFPFARGEIALDADPESLTAEQQRGRALFLSTCISCHDRARVNDEGPAWAARPVSWPRLGFVPPFVTGASAPPVDAVSSASVYAVHDIVPAIAGLTPREKRGEALFQANCAFCHGATGTGKNWIGQFMEPKARDLTAYTRAQMPVERLRQVIREGLPGTSMPAWQHVFTPSQVDEVEAYVRRAFLRDEAARSADTAR